MFKERLKKMREHKELSQTELANKVGLSQSLIAGFELGTRKPSGDAIIAIADVLDCTTDYLLGRTN